VYTNDYPYPDPRQVLGLIWAMMMRYLKFSEDQDEKVSAKDALLQVRLFVDAVVVVMSLKLFLFFSPQHRT
jgi:hypothetical protein